MERGTQIVIEMLSKGIAQAEVARIVGCTPSAVSQVASAYADQITTAQQYATDSETVMEDAMDRIEKQLLQKIEQTLPLETDLMKITKMFQVVNGAKRRSRGEGHTVHGNVTIDNRKVVALNLPAHMQKKVEYVTNPQNQVVEINGRNLAIASNKMVERMAGLEEETEEVSQDESEQASQHSTNLALSGDGSGQGSSTLLQEDSRSSKQADSSTATTLTVEDFEGF